VALAGIDAKIARASEHMTALHDEMISWDTRRPWRLSHEVHDEGRKHLWRLRMDAEIPVEWAVILGEIVHNLRSASPERLLARHRLDQEARPRIGLPRLHPQIRVRPAQKKSTTEWSSTSGMYKIRGIGPAHTHLSRRCRPYPQRCGQRRDRLALRLSPRLLEPRQAPTCHLWGLRITDDALELPVQIADDCVLGIDRRLRHEGAIVMKLLCDPPHPEVE